MGEIFALSSIDERILLPADAWLHWPYSEMWVKELRSSVVWEPVCWTDTCSVGSGYSNSSNPSKLTLHEVERTHNSVNCFAIIIGRSMIGETLCQALEGLLGMGFGAFRWNLRAATL